MKLKDYIALFVVVTLAVIAGTFLSRPMLSTHETKVLNYGRDRLPSDNTTEAEWLAFHMRQGWRVEAVIPSSEYSSREYVLVRP